MSRARRRAIAWVLALAVLAAATIALIARREPSPSLAAGASAERPALLLLTSLPLLFGEQFSLEQKRSPAVAALETRYRLVPISVASAAELRKGRLLLMAHPLAQPAEDLVALDEWVRSGGRVLLLADPLLEWPSQRPLGDNLRPPPMFMDTGLLRHWGLRLDAPDEPGPVMRRLGGFEVMAASPGQLFGRCAISADRLVAHCAIGKGAVTVVADADLLGVEQLDGPIDRNLDGLLAELARLEQK